MSHLGCVHIRSLKASSDESSGDEYQHCHGDPVDLDENVFFVNVYNNKIEYQSVSLVV